MPRTSSFSCLGVLVALLLLALAAPDDAEAKPKRIVSMNLCTDQLVLLLADRQHIASLSYLAVDPEASTMSEEAKGLPINHGLSEEILPLNPDLVIAGEYTTRPTVFLLQKLGYPVVEVPVETTLDDIRRNIRIVARAVGEVRRGEALIEIFNSKLPMKDPEGAKETAPLAALYWGNGYTSGQGTLANEMVEQAGFRGLGQELGISGTGQLPLETLLIAAPEVVIMGEARKTPSLATEIFRHPALNAAFGDTRIMRVPGHLWICGTPVIADVIAELNRMRQTLRTKP